MATVFLAEDLKHHRPVAIKLLHQELAAALGADRFLREIEIAARLQHPHILPLYDSGRAGGFLYYVDRKSTRLNSSHDQISYAVFCLKKKNRPAPPPPRPKRRRPPPPPQHLPSARARARAPLNPRTVPLPRRQVRLPPHSSPHRSRAD